ncbi:hypothetical protein TNCV_2305971 [Trichonephila clavipes]|nr:hypothetical protein TNCV_2305971 [Trichonephila clavipes]
MSFLLCFVPENRQNQKEHDTRMQLLGVVTVSKRHKRTFKGNRNPGRSSANPQHQCRFKLISEDLRAPLALLDSRRSFLDPVKSSLSEFLQNPPGPWVPARSAQWRNRHYPTEK